MNFITHRQFFRIIYIFIFSLVTLNCQSQQLPYQNTKLTAEERAKDLLPRLTLAEKAALMQNNSPAIPRLGIKAYEWWNEALHGIARAGLATVFPQPIGMAATFDDQAVFDVFSIVSDEARAKHNDAFSKGEYGRYQGLTVWT
jgi:beta-glucosidase